MIESFLAQLSQLDGLMLSRLFAVAALAMVATIFVATRVTPWRRRRNAAILRALEVSGSNLTAARRSMDGDFVATFNPVPEPFCSLTMIGLRAPLGGAKAGHGRVRKKVDQLRFEGTLTAPVKTELRWGRGQIQGRAVRRGNEDQLWTHQRMDLTGSEFVVRGANPEAVQHALFALQQRFNPYICAVTVEADVEPNVVIAIELAYGFNGNDTPALLNSVCSTGRAALLG